MDIAFKVVPPKKIFKITGIQFMQINSLFQLYSSKIYENHFLNIADKFLMIADFFNYLLTGKKFSEYTIATTSQLLDLKTKDWSYKLIEEFGFPKKIFPKIIEPGSIIGKILGSISTETGINKNLKIIAPATHDTASAIVSVPVPFDEKDFLYISSGTWALFGTELNEPNTSENALKYNFTNEGGVFGTIRFLKNITCFWLIQECRRIWEEKSGKKMTFSKLTEEALDPSIKPFSFFIYPDSPDFLNPIDMPQAIKDFCKKTGQKIPHKKGEMVRCILESIAFRYREIYKNIKEIFPMKTFKTIYIVGGGAQNSALSQFTANATGITVKAGPIEATAIGNLLIQAYNEYNIKSLKEIRKIVRNSQNIITFRPEERSFWDEGFKKYKNYVKNY